MIPFGESPNTDKLKFQSRRQYFGHKVENAVLGGDIEITSNSNARCSSSRVFFAHLDLGLSSREEFSDVFKKLASPIVCVCFQSVLEGYLDFITTKNALSSLGFGGGRRRGWVKEKIQNPSGGVRKIHNTQKTEQGSTL